jgi:hypothetical protein
MAEHDATASLFFYISVSLNLLTLHPENKFETKYNIVMKKLVLLTFTLLFAAAAFSQSQILLTNEFGPTSLAPSITFNGAPGDNDIVSHVTVTNTGTTNVTIKVAREQMFIVDGSMNQFCWDGVCFSPTTDTSATSMTLAPGGSTEEFSGHYVPQGTEGVSIVKYTFYDVNNPANASSVIVHYNSLFSLSTEAGVAVSDHIRLLSGTVDDPISGVIKVHNHASVPLNFIALKGAQIVLPGTQNWFSFGGVEYPAGVDTSGLVQIPATTIDESFEATYDADGVVGTSQVVYVFQDPTNLASYAIMMFTYDAAGTGISDEILANTEFSAAYPNPAESFVSFDYDIPAGVDKAEIALTNLLGSVVRVSMLEGMNGTARIDLSGLNGGIYFATLKLNDQIATSQKILVR